MKNNHLTGILSLGLGLACLSNLTFANKAEAFSLFSANLSGSQETIPNNSTATGIGSVLLNDAENQITVNLSWIGLTAPATAAHIHGAAAQGSNAPVLFGFSGVPNSISGNISEQSFAINTTQVSDLKNGLFYFNVHNANFPAGEIRGQITAVPEPVTILGSLTAIGFCARFKKKLSQNSNLQKKT